jgi:hypothetical protein
MFISSLFIPYEYKATFSPIYEKGYYVSLETFISLDHPSKTYYIPSKGMGMDPFENEIWTHFDGIENRLTTVLKKSKPYCAAKQRFLFIFFIVWW